MSARDTARHIVTKAGIGFGALFLVGVLLAAMPSHKVAEPEASAVQDPWATQPANDRLPQTDIGEHGPKAGAVEVISGQRDSHSLPMGNSATRARSAGGGQRGNRLVKQVATN